MGSQPDVTTCSDFVTKIIFIFRPSKIRVGSLAPKEHNFGEKVSLPWLNKNGVREGGKNDKAFFMADGLSCFDHLSLAFCESVISRLRHPICSLFSALPRLRLLIISCG